MLPPRRILGLVYCAMITLAGGGLTPSLVAASPVACTVQSAKWRFHTGSPLAGAPSALVQDATTIVFVASHEGYVHAIRNDGRFLWSYTVSGGITRPLSVDPDGRLYAVSAPGRIHTFLPDGRLAWLFKSPIGPETRLAVNPRGSLYFGRGSYLYAASATGGLLWSVDFGAEIIGGPLTSSSGWTWTLTAAGRIDGVKSALKHRKFSVQEEAPTALALAGRVLLVLGQDGVTAYDETGERMWHRSSVLFIQEAPESSLGAATKDSILRLDLATGQVLFARQLPADPTLGDALMPSDAPLFVGGRAFLPTRQGELVVVDDQGVTLCKIANSPLLSPVRADAGTIVLGAGDGTVMALQIDPEP